MDQKQKQNLLKTIRGLKQPDEKVFLVGGAVRDQILGLPVHDLDFTVRENPEPLARKLANHLKAGFYILDDLRHTARVVWKRDFEESTTLDFSKFRGVSIEDDLRGRDFTLNAIAVDLDHPSKVVDPLKGRGALKARHLQLCSTDSLKEDPIRVLRAVRFAVKFDLEVDPSLMKGLKKTGNLTAQ